jgi:hypothetical protein
MFNVVIKGCMKLFVIYVSKSAVGDPVTDHGLLNPTYLEALLWEGQRYQSLYKSPIGVDAAFIAPLASSASWFPNFAYETMKQLMLAILHVFMWLRELLRSILMELRGKRGERYEPISLIETS